MGTQGKSLPSRLEKQMENHRAESHVATAVGAGASGRQTWTVVYELPEALCGQLWALKPPGHPVRGQWNTTAKLSEWIRETK